MNTCGSRLAVLMVASFCIICCGPGLNLGVGVQAGGLSAREKKKELLELTRYMATSAQQTVHVTPKLIVSAEVCRLAFFDAPFVCFCLAPAPSRKSGAALVCARLKG